VRRLHQMDQFQLVLEQIQSHAKHVSPAEETYA
jgi:hypothetical protein